MRRIQVLAGPHGSSQRRAEPQTGQENGDVSPTLVPFPLQKGAGFHLDLLCVSLLMAVTSVIGLPWYVSATVISLAHMESLRRESATSAPGEHPKFLGIR